MAGRGVLRQRRELVEQIIRVRVDGAREIDPNLRAEYSVVAKNSAGATTIQVAKFPSDRVLDMLLEHAPVT